MQSLYVYNNSADDILGIQPITLGGYYLTGYHDTPIKVGERAILLFNKDPDGKDFREEIVRIMSIRFQFWNGTDDPNTNPDKSILEETIPSYKNWIKVQFTSEEREQKLNELCS